jgi:hypothetical protein
MTQASRLAITASNMTETTMDRIVSDILLFSCLAAFCTGIMVAAASMLS